MPAFCSEVGNVIGVIDAAILNKMQKMMLMCREEIEDYC